MLMAKKRNLKIFEQNLILITISFQELLMKSTKKQFKKFLKKCLKKGTFTKEIM
ncbi:methionine--tRNA ligase domain protein, partial [Chlamydia psittaci 01DC11]